MAAGRLITVRCTNCGRKIERQRLRKHGRAYCTARCEATPGAWPSPNNKKPWSEKEDSFLRANYRKMSLRDMAKALGRRFAGTRARLTKLTCFRQQCGWTPAEDKFLRDHRDRGWGWCAQRLNRTVISVRSRVRRIGVQLKMLKAGDLARLRRMHSEGLGKIQIARALGVSGECVRRWLRLWKLPSNRDEKARVETQRRNFQKNYGVENVAQARKVIRRRANRVSLVAGLESLRKQLEDKVANGLARCGT